MTDVKLVREKLKELLEKDIDPYYFPVQKGNKINIGSFSIAKTRDGYSVKSYKTQRVIAITYSKASAIAIAKNLSKGKNITSKIMELDKIIQKNANDCMFYRHTMKVTKNSHTFESTANRYDIANQIVQDTKEKINRFIL